MDTRSERNVIGVNAHLVAVVRLAHEFMSDREDGLGFIVTEGLRSQIRQAELVKAGASWTMESRHLHGEAIDVAATVNGEVRWDWSLYYPIAATMKEASADLGHVLTWGGVWDKFLSEYDDMDDAVAEYVARRKRLGKKANIDGPHFQIEQAHQQA